MDLLWLLIMLAGLFLVWLAIFGLERLVKRVKNKDTAIRAEADALEEKIEQEESLFLRKEAAKNVIETDLEGKATPEVIDAFNILSSDELIDSLCIRVFGDKESNEKKITADKSAFDTAPEKVAIANGNGMLPIKTKSSTKSGLSKEEKKLMSKIKRGS